MASSLRLSDAFIDTSLRTARKREARREAALEVVEMAARAALVADVGEYDTELGRADIGATSKTTKGDTALIWPAAAGFGGFVRMCFPGR